jgi:hypothetical protein
MFVNISEFRNNLGPEADKIMEYCLGKDWRNIGIKESREMFNKALSISLETDSIITESALVIRDAYNKKQNENQSTRFI